MYGGMRERRRRSAGNRTQWRGVEDEDPFFFFLIFSK